MRIFCCQLDIVWEDKKANFDRVLRQFRGRSIPRGSMIILPEMFATGFTMNVEVAAEGAGAPTEAFLKGMAVELGIWVLGGLVREAGSGRGRNEAVVYTPEGREAARYRKMQPFNLGGEGAHYPPGQAPVTFEWGEMVVAPFICYDLRFPELFREAVRRGVHFFPVIANWPSPRTEHWLTLLRARAIENQAYVVGVNRCGKDPYHHYTGRTVVVNPHGELVADAGEVETVIEAELDLGLVESWRKAFPALADMRDEP